MPKSQSQPPLVQSSSQPQLPVFTRQPMNDAQTSSQQQISITNQVINNNGESSSYKSQMFSSLNHQEQVVQ